MTTMIALCCFTLLLLCIQVNAFQIYQIDPSDYEMMIPPKLNKHFIRQSDHIDKYHSEERAWRSVVPTGSVTPHENTHDARAILHQDTFPLESNHPIDTNMFITPYVEDHLLRQNDHIDHYLNEERLLLINHPSSSTATRSSIDNDPKLEEERLDNVLSLENQKQHLKDRMMMTTKLTPVFYSSSVDFINNSVGDGSEAMMMTLNDHSSQVGVGIMQDDDNTGVDLILEDWHLNSMEQHQSPKTTQFMKPKQQDDYDPYYLAP